MEFSKTFKKPIKFIIDNYFILIFLACVGFVGIVSFYKLFISKPTYVYVKVKVGQGQWWTNYTKPPIWFVKSIKKGQIQKDLLGKENAKIVSVRYYPYYYYGSENTVYTNQYDIFVTMKLLVSGNSKTDRYNFNRSSVGVGTTVDFEFPQVQFSGTVIDISNQPITENFKTETVHFTKMSADFNEYNAIRIGDRFFDGEEPVFEVLDKSYQQDTKQITIKTKIKVKAVDNQFVFGEEQIVSLGKTIYIITPNFSFTNYVVAEIE